VTSNDLDTSEDDYLQVIRAKTAELFAAAARIGAIVADRAPAGGCARSLRSQSRHLVPAGRRRARLRGVAGRARQTVATTSARARSPCPSSWRSAAALPRSASSGGARSRISSSDDDLARAQALLERYGALTETVERARHYGSLAGSARRLPRRSERRALVEAAQFAIERAY